jgi:uncharacterized protein (DUF2384 family)
MRKLAGDAGNKATDRSAMSGRSGAMPRYIVARLQEYYTADEIRTWLDARHPQLDGGRAIDLIHQNRSEAVLRVLDRLDAEVYL